MITHRPITTTTSKNQNQEKDQEPGPLPDTDHYAEQTTRHDQQDTDTKRSRERSEDAHLGITIRGSGPASGLPEGPTRSAVVAQPPLSIFAGSSGC